MLKELIVHSNSIKKIQADEGYTKWNKENLQGTNSRGDETENEINVWEHKEEKRVQSE